MGTIDITQPIQITPPAVTVPAAKPVQDQNANVLPPDGIPDQVGYSAQVAEQTRAQAVVQVAQHIANNFILGDQTFSLFKDSTGQYITRFTNLRDGKVTYIPEPTLFKLGGSSAPDTTRILKIQA